MIATLPSTFISAPGACATIAVVASTAAENTDAAVVTSSTGSSATNAKITEAATFTKVSIANNATAAPGTAGTVKAAKGCVLYHGIPGSSAYVG